MIWARMWPYSHILLIVCVCFLLYSLPGLPCHTFSSGFPSASFTKTKNNTAHTHLCLSICYYFLRGHVSYATVPFLSLVEVRWPRVFSFALYSSLNGTLNARYHLFIVQSDLLWRVHTPLDINITYHLAYFNLGFLRSNNLHSELW